MIDLIIKNARIVDGSGAPSYAGSVAVDGGRIVGTGDAWREARRVIDAGGLAVAPGFFDMHTHYDAQLLWDPLCTSSCWHGVTTVLTGNCGFSIAPAAARDREYTKQLFCRVEGIPLDIFERVVSWEWESFGEFLDKLPPPGVNVATQVGHSALRHYVMGQESHEREAKPGEIAAMAEVLKESVRQGAAGFSTLKADFERGPDGGPVPSQCATLDELRALGMALGELGRGVMTISPHPGAADISPEFQDFLIELSRDSGRPMVWNAFQHRWDMPDKWKELLAFMETAAEREARVYSVAKCQRLDLEFDLRSTTMFNWFPTWDAIIKKPHEEKLRLFAEPSVRETLRDEYLNLPAEGAGSMVNRSKIVHVREVRLPEHEAYVDRRVADAAAERGENLVDFMLDLALAEDLSTRFVYYGLMNGDMDAVSEILKGPYCLPGVSDAGAHLDMDCGVDFTGRFLGHWVREREIMSIEEGVRRLTSMPAAILGYHDRGLVAEGMAADLVLFDPDTIQAKPREWLDDVPGGGRRIVQRPVGVKAVFVNGEALIEEGEHTGARPGKLLPAGA